MTGASLTAERLARIERAIETVPYARLLGIQLEKVAPGEADTATAFAILTLLEPDERVTTVDLTVSYLRPAVEGTLQATARVLRQGRRLFTVSAELADSGGTLLTTALSTYIKL